ncbi:MAG: Co2+/Mg2+ efflux protein ApaG [Asticcacaulis sp.]|nr:Co2+/Mg2+ efflux protein ApaG [Asticcacaulis sp.]
MSYQQTSFGITVRVEVDYVPQEDNTGEERYLWAYHITLINGSHDVVQLKTRHWTIMDALGRVQKVDGPGVVGQTPVLKPGETYSYSSGCPLSTSSGAMSGHYMFMREDGLPIKVMIPAFSLDLPDIKRVLN